MSEEAQTLLNAPEKVALWLFGLIDSLGQTFYAYFRYAGWSSGLSTLHKTFVIAAATGIAGLVAFAQKIAVLLGERPGKGRIKLSLNILAYAASFLLLVVVLVSLSGISHGIAWGWRLPQGNPGKIIFENLQPKDKVSLSREQYIVVDKNVPGPRPSHEDGQTRSMRSLGWLWTLLVAGAALSYAFGVTFQFLNQSSHEPLYSTRLTRAYLGASNPRRWKDTWRSITEPIECDQVELKGYKPQARGGPLHLINVTINETISGKSNIDQRDRKGQGMAVDPCGISVSVKHHSIWTELSESAQRFAAKGFAPDMLVPIPLRKDEYNVFPPGDSDSAIEAEPLALGRWTAISGAGFSTGLGSKTSLGLSLLCGLANIRLGHWWNSGVGPEMRKLRGEGRRNGIGSYRPQLPLGGWLARILPVQMYLLDEFLARFHGPARRYWYLSDGGHFENTACYELIRRRLPFIIVRDNGYDPIYEFSDVANMVRKARTDFNAEITFFTESELDARDSSVRPFFSTLDQLRRGKWSEEPVEENAPPNQKRKTLDPDPKGLSLAHAALASVRYDGSKTTQSILLLIKPSLTGDEPIDLVEYHTSHPDFPQEPTSDQYFDEAQWESYRKLGEHVGLMLLDSPQKESPTEKWSPAQMQVEILLDHTNNKKL